jgi:hypothetical protein
MKIDRVSTTTKINFKIKKAVKDIRTYILVTNLKAF